MDQIEQCDEQYFLTPAGYSAAERTRLDRLCADAGGDGATVFFAQDDIAICNDMQDAVRALEDAS